MERTNVVVFVGVLRLNHAVLYVSDPKVSSAFYSEMLGLLVTVSDHAGRFVFMKSPASPNDHDLGLFQAPSSGTPGRKVGLYHLAWEVETLGELAEVARKLSRAGALVGASDHGVSKSVYAQDPDGIEFEVMWPVPEELCESDVPYVAPLDLDAEIRRFGADTPGRRTDPRRSSDPQSR